MKTLEQTPVVVKKEMLRIVVTEEDILNGNHSAFSCPVAKAAKRYLGLAGYGQYISVSPVVAGSEQWVIRVHKTEKGEPIKIGTNVIVPRRVTKEQYFIPEEAARIIQLYDSAEQMEPFAFDAEKE